MAWLNGEDNWYDCMVCGEKFFANEYHPRCERCEARLRIRRMGLLPKKKKEAK